MSAQSLSRLSIAFLFSAVALPGHALAIDLTPQAKAAQELLSVACSDLVVSGTANEPRIETCLSTMVGMAQDMANHQMAYYSIANWGDTAGAYDAGRKQMAIQIFCNLMANAPAVPRIEDRIGDVTDKIAQCLSEIYKSSVNQNISAPARDVKDPFNVQYQQVVEYSAYCVDGLLDQLSWQQCQTAIKAGLKMPTP